MLSELPNERLIPRLQIIVYVGVAIFLTMIFTDQFFQGLYKLVLANIAAIPALIFSATYIYLNRDNKSYELVNLPLMVVLAFLALSQVPTHKQLMLHYLYALPLFSYFSLPLKTGTYYNISVLFSMFVLIAINENLFDALRDAINLSLMMGSAWCFAYLTQLKGLSLKRLSLTDPLSGAYNQRHFKHVLEREVSRCSAMRQKMSLVGIVIEDYQQLIDLHGPTTVLGFLPSFTDRARLQIRAEDELFRIDDDLFVMLLPNCGEEGAIVLTERVTRKLQDYQWPGFVEMQLHVSAVTRNPNESAEAFEKRLLGRLKAQKRTSLQLVAFNSETSQ